MRFILDILRRKDAASEPYLLSVPFETESETAAVSYALTEINKNSGRADINGEPFEPIRWECSCLQKKCGACAMVINSRPMLACDARLSEVAKKGRIRLEPLKKFPPVADLTVDREAMFKALAQMRTWLTADAKTDSRLTDTAFEASKCLQCGCCLEICPNFYVGAEFFGTAAAVPAARLMAAERDKDRDKLYTRHFYNGCGKSLACKDICPAGIDTDSLIVRANSAAVWRRKRLF